MAITTAAMIFCFPPFFLPSSSVFVFLAMAVGSLGGRAGCFGDVGGDVAGDVHRVGGEDDHLHPAVERPVFGAVVQVAGVGVGVAGGREAGGGKAATLYQPPEHLGRPVGREFPVGGEALPVGGEVVGVALDDHQVVDVGQHQDDLVEDVEPFLRQGGRARLEEDHVPAAQHGA